MSAPDKPMDPQQLADLREGLDDNRETERPVPHDLVCELLADRDRLAAEVEEARAVALKWRSTGWGDPLGKHPFPWEPGS